MVAGGAQTSFVFGLFFFFFFFPASSAEAERQTQTLAGSVHLSGQSRPPGLLDFSAHPPGQRFDMSQVLFLQLVPLQVKCKDCEER